MADAKYIYEDDAIVDEIHHEGLEPSKSIIPKSKPKGVTKLEYIESTGKILIHTEKEIPELADKVVIK